MTNIFEFFKSKNFKFGFVALIMAAAVIAITAIVNFLVAGVNVKWDLTPNKMYSIGDTTTKLLEGLQKDVEIVFLIDRDRIVGGDNGFLVAEFLDKYDKFGRIKVNYIDPDKNPDIISKLDKEGILELKKEDIIVKCGDRVKKLTVADVFQYSDPYAMDSQLFVGEQSITGAIKYVTSDRIPTIYFIEGHGEKNLNSEYSTIKQSLELNSYAVKTLNLTLEEKVPEDTEILISAAPQMDFASNEKDKISEYLQNGGKAIFLMEPVNTAKKFTNIEGILEKYNIGINYDRVKETDSNRHIPQNEFQIVPDIGSNELTSNLDLRQFFVVIPESRSFRVLDPENTSIEINKLLTSSYTSEGVPFDSSAEGGNSKGPLDIALTAKDSSTKDSKVVVIGNASFATDATIQSFPYAQNAIHLFFNSIIWMHDDSNDLIIMPKTPELDSITVTGFQAMVTMMVTILAIPILLIAAGIFIWLRRRHL
ncbi:MAG: GldG family protein [Clostridiaceae bacterium]|nr:GldG family protein [Clostridiaceae bacterium]